MPVTDIIEINYVKSSSNIENYALYNLSDPYKKETRTVAHSNQLLTHDNENRCQPKYTKHAFMECGVTKWFGSVTVT